MREADQLMLWFRLATFWEPLLGISQVSRLKRAKVQCLRNLGAGCGGECACGNVRTDLPPHGTGL